MPQDCYYLFENFYKSLLFSLVFLLLWSLLRKIIKKPIRKERYENYKETLGWYFRFKLHIMVMYFFTSRDTFFLYFTFFSFTVLVVYCLIIDLLYFTRVHC